MQFSQEARAPRGAPRRAGAIAPPLIMAGRVGQAIAVQLGLGEGRTVGDQVAADAPEDADEGLQRSACGC